LAQFRVAGSLDCPRQLQLRVLIAKVD